MRTKKNPAPQKKSTRYYAYEVFLHTGKTQFFDSFPTLAQARNWAKESLKDVSADYAIIYRDAAKMPGQIGIKREEIERINKNPVKRKLTARPKPAGKLNRKVFIVESGDKENGPWKIEGFFPSENQAREYAAALDEKYSREKWIRVTV